MADDPFATIVIPTKARPELLRRALASVQAQVDATWEAIVVDDGDGEGIQVAAQVSDRRVRGVRNHGEGMVDARSTAVSLARGRMLCWLDDDDWWEDPSHLSSLLRASAPERFFFRGGWIVYETGPGDPRRDVFDHDATCGSLRENNTVLTSSIAYPRTAHDELGPLDRSLFGYCDWDFMLRMCDAGFQPSKLPGLAICYSSRADNSSADVTAPDRLLGFTRFAAKHSLDVQIESHVTIHRLLTDGRPASSSA